MGFLREYCFERSSSEHAVKGEEALVISYVIQTRQIVVSINSSVRRALDRQVIRLFSISVIRFPVSVQHVPRAWRKSCWSRHE